MTDHILDIAETPARLRSRDGLLVLEFEERPAVTVPLKEVAAVIVTHPQITCSKAVMAGLMEAGGVLIACDESSMPIGMMLPLVGHHAPAERFAAQADASVPTRKRLWRQVVKAKITAQGALLAEVRGDDFGLSALAAGVRSGDPANHEAQASRRYWPALFNDPNFLRRRDAADQNRLLNYGYAILRAAVARALCASGLHPCLGIHHHNRYNPFCLADDIMEPYRPIVDRAVLEIVGDFGADVALDRAVKSRLIEAVTQRQTLDGQSRTLFDILSQTSASLAAVFAGEADRLILPDAPARQRS